MANETLLAQHFETQRPRLVAVARGLLGSAAEAEDVVQDAWLRLQRVDPDELDNVDAWLTTVVSRLSLDVLRSGRHTRERAWKVTEWPDQSGDRDPAVEIDQGDRVSVALVTILELLSPAERLAFMLHDVFGLPFDEVAPLMNRSADAARQLASRARRRVQGAPTPVPRDHRRERPIVDAWLAAVTHGDFESLLALLDEGAVLQAHYGAHSQQLRGSRQIAESATMAARLAAHSVAILIDGMPGVAAVLNGRVVSLMAFNIVDGHIMRLEVLADPARLASLELPTD